MTHSTQLPIIDIGAFSHDANQRAAIAQAVRNALSDCGFMYICGHGIDSALIARAVAEAQRFFATSPHDKQQLAYTDIDTNFGYQGIEVESLDPSNLPDLKEAFTMRNALAVGAHLRHWPTTEFRDVALAFYEAGLAAAHRIMTVLAACLELPSDFFRVRHQGENVTLRFLHYPANLSIKAGTQLGAGLGAEASLQGGSYGHGMASAQWGISDGDFSFYGAAEGVTDAGWRFHSQSNLARLYADAGWRFGNSEIHLVASGAATSLGVVGPTPLGLIQRNAKSIYTFPQTTRNTTGSLALNGKTRLDEHWQIEAAAYMRSLRLRRRD